MDRLHRRGLRRVQLGEEGVGIGCWVAHDGAAFLLIGQSTILLQSRRVEQLFDREAVQKQGLSIKFKWCILSCRKAEPIE